MAIRDFTAVSNRRLLVAALAVLLLAVVGITPWKVIRATAQVPPGLPGGPTNPEVAQLLDQLTDPNPEVQSQAAWALRQLTPTVEPPAALAPAVPALLTAMQSDDVDVRASATRTWESVVARLKDDDVTLGALPILSAMLHDQDPAPRFEAAHAAAWVAYSTGDVSDAAMLELATSRLVEALGSNDAELRYRAAQGIQFAVAGLPDPTVALSAVPQLVAALGADLPLERTFARRAIDAMARHLDDTTPLLPAVDALTQTLDVGSSDLNAVISAIGRIAARADDGEAVVPAARALEAAMADDSAAVRQAAVTALWYLAAGSARTAVAEAAAGPLAEAVRDADPDVRGTACSGLSGICWATNDVRVLRPLCAPLIAALTDASPTQGGDYPHGKGGKYLPGQVRGQAAWATLHLARRLQDPAALQAALAPVGAILRDADTNSRIAAVELLETMALIGTDGASLEPVVPGVAEALGDEDAELRGRAAWALHAIAPVVQAKSLGPTLVPLAELAATPIEFKARGFPPTVAEPASGPEVRAPWAAGWALSALAARLAEPTTGETCAMAAQRMLATDQEHQRWLGARLAGQVAAAGPGGAGHAMAVAALVGALEDPARVVRTEAAAAGKWLPASARPAVERVSACGRALVRETFDSGTAGWGPAGNMNVTLGADISRGGKCLTAIEVGPEKAFFEGWQTTSALTGDLSDAYNGSLRFEIKAEGRRGYYYPGRVSISGGGVEIAAWIPYTPGPDWTPYCLPLDEATFPEWDEGLGQVPTERSVVLRCLADVESISFRGAWYGAIPGRVHFDNFVLSAGREGT